MEQSGNPGERTTVDLLVKRLHDIWPQVRLAGLFQRCRLVWKPRRGMRVWEQATLFAHVSNHSVCCLFAHAILHHGG